VSEGNNYISSRNFGNCPLIRVKSSFARLCFHFLRLVEMRDEIDRACNTNVEKSNACRKFAAERE
jgi:hypothetical protein